MYPATRIILPHHKHGARAHAVSLDALALYVLFIFVSVFSFQLLAKQSGLVLGYATDIRVDEIISLTNGEREAKGLKDVVYNEKLAEAAKMKAEDMFEDDYWAHIARDGTTPWYFIEKTGYEFSSAGENLARDFNDSEAVVRAWMDSPSHRDNLLGENYVDIGVAVVDGELAGEETTLVVQMFGVPRGVTAAALAPEEPKVEITPQAAKLTPQPSSTEQQGTEEKESEVGGDTNNSLPLADFARYATMLFVVFLLSVFALDVYVVWKKGIIRVSGNTMAHIGMLLFILGAIWWANGGIIL